MPIARFEHLPLARDMCRFKVVHVARTNATPFGYADMPASDFGLGRKRGKQLLEHRCCLYRSTGIEKFQVPQFAKLKPKEAFRNT
jgi:hypothetical protein